LNRNRQTYGSTGAEVLAANVLAPEDVQVAALNGKILLVEDEAGLVLTLSDRLRNEGYWVEVARDGLQGLDRALNDTFDLIILDVMLPQKSGIDVCRDLRQNGLAVPILMLTARSQTVDKVLGLKIGADDYVTKPFDMLELLARVEALLRRAPGTPTSLGTVHQIGAIRVDLRRTQVWRDGQPVALSAREFQLLRYFLEHRGATLSRSELLQQVWGYGATTGTRTVDVHVAGLRQKLESDPKQPRLILTVLGLGYKFAG
jgi:two-component system, OmpR family, alkaline phosphatase synthesis response regulator PhoP